jgi:YgiT-type zinc finger domain-containing protein
MAPRFDPCEQCGGKVRLKRVTVDFRRKGKLFIFENTPIGVCQKCGERYYPGPVLERMEELASHEELITESVRVPKVDFSEAAV